MKVADMTVEDMVKILFSTERNESDRAKRLTAYKILTGLAWCIDEDHLDIIEDELQRLRRNASDDNNGTD